MTELEVRIPCGDFTLEARFARGTTGGVAVLCHPHPLSGGDLHNNVVVASRDALDHAGIGTLRFNFRGAGHSGGAFDGGRGEAQDLLAAIAYVGASDPPVQEISVVGYSFGAWVALLATRSGARPAALALISPPVDFLDFRGLALPSCPTLVLAGDQDSFCSLESLRRWLENQPAGCDVRLRVLPGNDHFHAGQEGVLRRELIQFFSA
jgi:hypothetical protein